ncbi:MAG: HypC/HybG/HupF family hydrogenase formation chaperone [Nitrospirae bacterium]|nr:HypC/HybG/HupF family hydrogenase formation chaperone [Nitrospirota bacterium]
MCLAVPVFVVEVLEGSRARVRLGGVVQEVSTVLVDNVREGDYLIVHVGFALSRLDQEEAQRTLALMEEMSRAGGGS